MKKLSALLVGLLLCFLAAAAPRPLRAVTVMMVNQAGAPQSVVQAAQQEAAWLFRRTGIGITWIDCDRAAYDAGAGRCRESASPLFFAVQLITEDRREGSSRNAMGFAMPKVGGGNHAAIVLPRLRQFAHRFPDIPAEPSLLGYAIAHELGHLFLGYLEHGPGVMKARWDRGEYAAISRRQMVFTSEQAGAMQQTLSRRELTVTAAFY